MTCSICKAQNHTARTCPDKKCDNCGSFLRDHPDGVCPKKIYECPHTPLHRIAFGKCVLTGKKCTNCGSNTHKNSIKTPCLPVFVCPHEVLHHTFIECQRAHTVIVPTAIMLIVRTKNSVRNVKTATRVIYPFATITRNATFMRPA